MADIKISYCIALHNVLTKILFDYDKDGKLLERKLPFNVKYKLQKNLNIVSKDYLFFETERNNIIKKYGEEKENKIKLKEENFEDYKSEVEKLLDMEVSRNLLKLSDEEVESIGDVEADCAEMEVFIEYLTDKE